MTEIERKFLLEQRPDWLQRFDSVEIEQCYLGTDGRAEVRVRRAGDEHTLTVKLGEGLAREEVEAAIDGERAEPLWSAREGRLLTKRRHLVPLEDGLIAEIDVYGGELEGLAVAEVEFESRADAALFDPPTWFGREVSGDSRYGNRSLALGGVPRPRRKPTGPSRAYRLKRKEDAATGLRRIAAGRASKALERLRGSGPGEDGFADAVHGARKDLKKLRAVVRLLREALGEKAYEEENDRFRDAARQLAASRDAQVKLETLIALAKGDEDLPDDAVRLWRGELEREVERSGDSAASVAEAIARIEAGAERIRSWRLEGDSWKLVEPGVLRVYARGRRAMRRVRREPSAEGFHEWRKRAKDLWYQLQLLHRAWRPVLAATTAEAHRLSELLGDHHDLALLDEDLGERRIEAGRTAALRAAIAARQEELAATALELGARLYAERPKAYRRRLRAYWRAH